MATPALLTVPPPACRFTPLQAAVCFGLAVLLDLAISAYQWPKLLQGRLLNPDSYMRLVRLHDILAQHAPIHVVARDGSGAGTVLHWSHLLDSLLLLLAAPLAALLGEPDALRWAGIVLGPLGIGCLGIALGWAAAPLSDPSRRWTAALVGALAMPIVAYALPSVIHHHVLVALSAVMCAGWAARAGSLGWHAGWQMGTWTLFGLWLSPEVMPIALMAFGAVGLGWLQHPGEPNWGAALAAGTTTLTLLTALALMVDPPLGGMLSAEVDRLSIAWLVLGVFGAAAGWSLYWLDRARLPPVPRALTGAAIAIVAGSAWLALFPTVLSGPEGVMNGQQAHAFDGISEMKPITSIDTAMFFLTPGVFGSVVALVLAVRRRTLQFAYVAACVLLLLLAGILHLRFSTYSACAGAIATPVAITMVSARLAGRPPFWAATARLAILLFLVITPLAAHWVTAATGAPKPPSADDGCNVSAAASALQPFAGRVVLGNVNDTPEILYRTGLLTVGSLYHRDAEGYLRLRAAWRAQDLDHVPPAVTATKASLLLFCRGAARSYMVTDLPADTLWDRLMRGDPPAWLHEVPMDQASGFRLFRIEGPG